MPELHCLAALFGVLRQRLTDLRRDERGMTTEAVIVTAALAALALAAVAIITTKVMAKANSIPTN